MRKLLSADLGFVTFLGLLLLAAAIAAFGPPERTLGNAVRIVYLHGAFVWTALLAFGFAALLGLAGLVFKSHTAHFWSQAAGRTGLVYWVGYIPLSMWAADATWNGVFLAEPRFRVAFAFAGAGLLLQLAAHLLEHPTWSSAINAGYFPALLIALARAGRLMHPVAPIRDASSRTIQVFFLALLALTCLAALQLTRWQRARAIPVAPQRPAREV